MFPFSIGSCIDLLQQNLEHFSSAEYLDFMKIPPDTEYHFSHALYVSVLLYNIIIMVFQFCDGAGQDKVSSGNSIYQA